MESSQSSTNTPNQNDDKNGSESFGNDSEDRNILEREEENGSGASIVSATSSDSKKFALETSSNEYNEENKEQYINYDTIKCEDDNNSSSFQHDVKNEFDSEYNDL